MQIWSSFLPQRGPHGVYSNRLRPKGDLIQRRAQYVLAEPRPNQVSNSFVSKCSLALNQLHYWEWLSELCYPITLSCLVYVRGLSPNYASSFLCTCRCTSRQYMSAIFYHNEQQKALAEETRDEEQKRRTSKIVTTILPAETFYDAEK